MEGLNLTEGDDLSEEQIEELLQRAEEKLRKKKHDQKSSSGVVYPAIPRPAKDIVSALPSPYVESKNEIAHTDPQRLLDVNEKKLANGVRKVEDPVALRAKKLKEKKATAGSKWYNLPRTKLTPELKRDLQIIKMRGVLDPKRHYKKDKKNAQVPEFSQIGTLIEGPTEFYSARIPKRERKSTLADDVLAAERQNHKFHKKYLEIQAAKTSGKKAYLKSRMAKRYGRRMKR